MISKIKGNIDSIEDESIVVDVSGIGYRVFVTSGTLSKVCKIGQYIELLIVHIFKQDQQILCGFMDNEEISVFNALLGVPGIGPKSALSILSKLSISDIAIAVAKQDPSIISSSNGIGKKTAERIIIELKGKIQKTTIGKSDYLANNVSVNDAILALLSLGYNKKKVEKAVDEALASLPSGAVVNDIIIQAMRLIQSYAN